MRAVLQFPEEKAPRCVVKERQFEDDWTAINATEFVWTEGNFSCDCNRSIVAGVEEMRCGQTVKLLGLRVTSDGLDEVLVA